MKEARFTKSEAARRLGISRRTVIRYVGCNWVSEDRKGRVRISEILAALGSPAVGRKRGMRADCRPNAHKMVRHGETYTTAYRLAQESPPKFHFTPWRGKTVHEALATDFGFGVATLAQRRIKAREWLELYGMLLATKQDETGKERYLTMMAETEREVEKLERAFGRPFGVFTEREQRKDSTPFPSPEALSQTTPRPQPG